MKRLLKDSLIVFFIHLLAIIFLFVFSLIVFSRVVILEEKVGWLEDHIIGGYNANNAEEETH